jgi:Flp pilus assembly protein TadD
MILRDFRVQRVSSLKHPHAIDELAARQGLSSRPLNVLAVSLAGLIVTSHFAAPAYGFPFARKKAETPAVTSPQAPGRGQAVASSIQNPGQASNASAAPEGQGQARTAPAAAAPPLKPATPAERQEARGRDLVFQSQFWLAELQKQPSDTEAAVEASNALRRIGSAERAVEVAAIGLQFKSEAPALWSALGLGLLAANKTENAVQALTKAASLNPRDASLQSALGVAFDRLGRADLAKAAYESGLAIAPQDSAILANYGLSVAMGGDLRTAETILRRAVQNPLAPPQARQNLALVVGLQGRFSESEQIASRDVPPTVAAENVAYLRQMLNGGESRWSQASRQGQ